MCLSSPENLVSKTELNSMKNSAMRTGTKLFEAKVTYAKSELFMNKLKGMCETCFPKGKNTKRAIKIGKSPFSLATKVMQVRLRELSEEVRIIKKLERVNGEPRQKTWQKC
jgi:hypothetical protein